MLSNSDDLTDALTAFRQAIKGKVRRVKIQRFSRPTSKLLKFLLLVLCLTLMKKTKKTILLRTITLTGITVVGIAAILLLFNGLKTDAQCKASIEPKMDIEEISLVNDAGTVIKFFSYIANDNSKRADGYQHICVDVINKTHILFVFPQSIEGKFHMQNVSTALDIGFFDSTGRLIRTMIMDTYADGNARLYSPEQPFQYALEARVGFFNEHQLSAGKAWLVVSSVSDSGL